MNLIDLYIVAVSGKIVTHYKDPPLWSTDVTVNGYGRISEHTVYASTEEELKQIVNLKPGDTILG